MTYICSKCTLLGSGTPAKPTCPCCGAPLKIRVRKTGENIIDGEYITVVEAASEILSIVGTFAHTKSQLYVSPSVDKFLKEFFPNLPANYKVDAKLLDFQMNVR